MEPGAHPVALDVAKSLVLEYLRALRGYRADSADGLARAVQECTVSVEHAEATLREFDHECPTPREIKETAFNVRRKFDPSMDEAEKWKEEGFDYDPEFYKQLPGQLHSMRHHAIGQVPDDYAHAKKMLADRPAGQFTPTMDDLMWRCIKKYLNVKEFSKVPWGQCWHAADKLGFPLNGHQREEMRQWAEVQPGKIGFEARPVPDGAIIQ